MTIEGIHYATKGQRIAQAAITMSSYDGEHDQQTHVSTLTCGEMTRNKIEAAP